MDRFTDQKECGRNKEYWVNDINEVKSNIDTMKENVNMRN